MVPVSQHLWIGDYDTIYAKEDDLYISRCSSTVHISSILHEEIMDKYSARTRC